MAIQPLNGAGNLTSAAVNAGTSITVAKPANVADGDLLIAAVFSRSSTVPMSTPPSGWTPVAPAGTEVTSVGLLRWYYKQIPSAAAEVATNYVWSGGSSGRTLAIVFRVTGALSSGFVDSVGAEPAGALGSSTPTITLPSVSPAGPADLLLALQVVNTSTGQTRGGFTPPAGITFFGAVGTTVGASESDLEVDVQILTAAGATGDKTFTKSTPISSAMGYLLTIKSAATPLTASLSVAPTGGTVPLVVTATADSTGGTGTAKTYAFDWGDGSTTPAQGSNVATHTYTDAGTYTVTVTVANT